MPTAAEPELRNSHYYACGLADARNQGECGDKAFHLGEMLRRKLAVPPGFVILNRAFQEFLDENALCAQIDRCLQQIDVQNTHSFTTAAQSISTLVQAAEVPASLLQEIALQLLELPAETKLAVRSSAIGEDSARAAFAGQLDSILHVQHHVESVVLGLKTCWASYWSNRALFYQQSREVKLQGMAVIVQAQVDSVISGVMFTRHPDLKMCAAFAEEMVVEYCPGLGDALMSGRINPGRILVSRHDGTWRIVAKPEPSDDSEEIVTLDDSLLASLTARAMTLEAAFGGPQDIEWTVNHKGQLFLLQSRPITVGATTSTERVPMVAWTNANVNENYPDPICPLLYSIASAGYYHYFRNLGLALGVSPRRIAAMEFPLQNIVGVQAGRLYYNLTNIHAVLRMAPFGKFLTESFNDFVGAVETPPGDERHSWHGFSRSRFTQAAEVLKIVCCTAWRFGNLRRGIIQFERVVDDFASTTNPFLLKGHTSAELLDHLRGFLEIRRHRWTNASLADAAAMISYGLLQRALRRDFPDADDAALHNVLLKGLRDVVSGMPAVRLWELSRQIRADGRLRTLFEKSDGSQILHALQFEEYALFRAQFEQYIEEWGFRCSQELMLTSPSFQESPESLLEILRAYVALDGESPNHRLMRQHAEREQRTRDVFIQLRQRWIAWFLPWPRKSFIVSRLLSWTQQAIALRERARLKQALLYSRLRRIALAMGNKMVVLGFVIQPDDVFFLTTSECESLLAGSSMFAQQTRELVALRRTAHETWNGQRPPDTFSLPAGAYWKPSASASSESCETSDNAFMQGTSVCGGRATGHAAVLYDVTEVERLSQGDILVTRQTDPGWGPVFLLVRGLVMERGGMLSHGAILAREYGLPAVVGIPFVTQRIGHGESITVNGDRGVVERA